MREALGTRSRRLPGSMQFRSHLVSSKVCLNRRVRKGPLLVALFRKWGGVRPKSVPRQRGHRSPSPNQLMGSRRCFEVAADIKAPAGLARLLSLSPQSAAAPRIGCSHRSASLQSLAQGWQLSVTDRNKRSSSDAAYCLNSVVSSPMPSIATRHRIDRLLHDADRRAAGDQRAPSPHEIDRSPSLRSSGLRLLALLLLSCCLFGPRLR